MSEQFERELERLHGMPNEEKKKEINRMPSEEVKESLSNSLDYLEKAGPLQVGLWIEKENGKGIYLGSMFSLMSSFNEMLNVLDPGFDPEGEGDWHKESIAWKSDWAVLFSITSYTDLEVHAEWLELVSEKAMGFLKQFGEQLSGQTQWTLEQLIDLPMSQELPGGHWQIR
jgi:hypothetical protein